MLSESKALPNWQTGQPPKPGAYAGYSDNHERGDEASLYVWNGRQWQHWTGLYDGAVSHWIALDLPYEERSSAALSHKDSRDE